MTGWTRRKFLKIVAGSVSGTRIATSVEARSGFLPERQAGSIDESDAGEPFDVCIIGSGPAGTVLACELVRHGIKTLLVEGGPVPGSPPRYKPRDYPIERTRFLGVGGTSNLWSGSCPRFQPLDFERANPYVPADAPWPITYKEIEPYYQRAESELQVQGGLPSRYSPPRASPYPFPIGPEPGFSWMEEVFREAGVVVEHPPLSARDGIRIAKSHLPRFVSSPRATFVRSARVLQILTKPGGAVTGVEARTPEGKTVTFRARLYVLACGGIETPRLLLLSRSSVFPGGIGNDYDLVGRYFMEHLVVTIGTATVKTRRRPPRGAVEALSWQFYEELKARRLGGAQFEVFLTPQSRQKADLGHPVDSLIRWWKGVDSRVLIAVMMEMRPSESNRVLLNEKRRDSFGLPEAVVSVEISKHERKTLKRIRDLALRVFDQLGAEQVELSDHEFNWTHHHMGTCRMGRDRRTSVIDEQLKVHGTQNLYVAGSAPFVTGGANGPTLLLTALSLRLADHLRAKLQTVASAERTLSKER